VFERIAAEPQIVTPTGIAVDHLGRVLVIESHTHFRPEGYQGPPADRIRVFEDRDHDGKPECTGTFFEGTRMTMNLAVARDGSVFVATRSAVYRLEDRDGDGRADETDRGKLPTPIIRLDTAGDYPHNGLSGFAFDYADTVYFGLGENLGADYRLIGSDGTILSGGGEGGNIFRCRPDGNDLERVATGFWNPFHMAFDAFGRLFAVDNDPDSRPPCRLLHIVEGGDYGYRFRNGRKGLHPFTAWNGELPGTLGMVAGTGEAPSGVVAYESNNLPADYRGTLLVTSWGDHRIEQYRLEPRGASFRATMAPVVAGGDDFRPVGIAAAPDGSLYVSDWVDKSYTLHGQGRIWRLRSAQVPTRGQRPPRAARPGVERDARHRARALEALAASPSSKSESVSSFLRDDSADVRALAARILPAARIDLKAIAASDASALVRADAMHRLADHSAKDGLLNALESDDPFVQQAACEGLRRSLKIDELIALAGTKDLTPIRRLGLLLILRASGQPEACAMVPGFLSDPDPRIHFAAIQWVGEQRLKALRPQLLAGLASSAATRNLFEATLAAVEQLDGKKRGPQDEIPGEDYIAALLKDARTSAPVLRRALRMLRPDHPALTLDRLRHFVNGHDEAVAIEAVRSFCQNPLAARFDALARLAEDKLVSLPLRAEAIVGLADDAPRQRKRLVALAMGEQPILRREALRSLRGIRLTEHEYSLLRATSRGDNASLELLEMLKDPERFREGGALPNVARTEPRPPGTTNGHQAFTGDVARTEPRPPGDAATGGRGESPTADLDSWLARLEGPADPAAGERVFFHSKGPGCFRCHQVEGRGGRAGPDLSALTAGMDRRRLVESILAPSKEIAPQFVAWSVARTDGTVVTGILLEQTPEGALVFADSQGRLIAVKHDEIAERKPQTTSIMPDNLVQSMTIQEFRDVVAFLWRRG
jgi:putative membrane-bound dehydrogenase-like protein